MVKLSGIFLGGRSSGEEHRPELLVHGKDCVFSLRWDAMRGSLLRIDLGEGQQGQSRGNS